MKKINLIFTIILLFLVFGIFYFLKYESQNQISKLKNIGVFNQQTEKLDEVEEKIVASENVLNEAGSMEESSSDIWWLNSGGLVYFDNEIGKTIQGDLDENNKWYQAYKKNNPRDTNDGKHPQNIFRLVTRGKWENLEQEAYFKINKDNLSISRYRNQSNGLLFFNRYQDGNNLYYTGIRVDGFAVIKKKINGIYYTMAYNRIITGKYNRKKNPNLLPHNVWIGLQSEVKNESDGSVSIKVFMDRNRDGNWKLIAEAKDDGKQYGGKAFLNEGYAGIRTDFMDVEFDDYKIEELK